MPLRVNPFFTSPSSQDTNRQWAFLTAPKACFRRVRTTAPLKPSPGKVFAQRADVDPPGTPAFSRVAVHFATAGSDPVQGPNQESS